MGVEHGGAVEVVVDASTSRTSRAAGRTEDGGQRQHDVARHLVAGEGGEPTGPELGTPKTRPRPCRSTENRRVTTPCTSPAGIANPCGGPATGLDARLTHGWLSTSER